MIENRYKECVYIWISDDYEFLAFIQLLKEINCKEYDHRGGFFGTASGYFVCDGIRVEMMFDMLGMFLYVPDSISDSDLAKFRKWAARMYELSQDERYKV